MRGSLSKVRAPCNAGIPILCCASITDGSGDFDILKVLFDLDFPAHYLRRIKLLSLLIPYVTSRELFVPNPW